MDIWLGIKDDPIRLEDVSDSKVEEAEKELNVDLPNAYVDLIKQQNGGVIKKNAFKVEFPNVWDEDLIYVNFIYGIGRNEGILDTKHLTKEWGLPDDLVLLSGDGHTWVALDYSDKGKEPPVIYYDTDEGVKHVLADTFSDFINGLTDDDTKNTELLMEDSMSIDKDKVSTLFSQENDIEKIVQTLDILQTYEDPNWTVDQLNSLLDRNNELITSTVGQTLMVILDIYFDELDKAKLISIAKKLSEKGEDGKIFAEIVKERL
ncbi:SMI1/KNR4 family protein [Halalkalibacterium halodurans]|uniref:SMI1/KNR4 family protein n=1 Tax=Halalkalibacterium halodurans TaxID=86665 RepID=UPI002E1B48D2|nr:SMI1/KNR4 family protein [Halalkalibacterium halodurans]